jgi:hypothetical protein
VLALSREAQNSFGSSLHTALLPAFVNRSLSPDQLPTQAELLGNFSPGDGPVLIPLWNNVPLDEAYGVFLSDSFESEKAKIGVDDSTSALLSSVMQRYRRTVHSKELSGRSPSENELSTTFAATLKQFTAAAKLQSKTANIRLLSLVKSYAEFLAFESLDDSPPKVWLDPPLPLKTERRFIFNGGVRLSSIIPNTSEDILGHATIAAQEYQIVPIRRPSWFRFDLLREGKQQSYTDKRLERYFGPSGYLERIPVAVIVEQLSSILVTPDPHDEAFTTFLASHDPIRISAGSHEYIVDGGLSKAISSAAVVRLGLANPRIRAIAIISEQLQ